MSRLGRHSKRDKVAIHVMEERPECHARHLLLLSIFLDTDLGPRERTEMFLEVYGNSQIRKQTSAYIQSKVQTLVRFLTDTEGGEVEKQLSSLVDISHLKSKQRDEIEKVILSWSEGVETGMGEWREKRMRNYYEDR
jgi:dynein assembly factor 3